MNIAILEDNSFDLEKLKKCIEIYFKNRNINYNLSIFDNSEQLIERVYYFDIVFLDINFGNENGIEIGMKIRKLSLKTILIITTKYMKYSIDGYRIRADRYLIKPIKQDIFNLEMENVLDMYYLPFVNVEKSNNLNIKDVLYIECIDRKTKVHLISEEVVETKLTMRQWSEKLGNEYFGQPHKSYLVNLLHVSGFTRQDVLMKNNEKIPLSRHYKHEFEIRYNFVLHKVI